MKEEITRISNDVAGVKVWQVVDRVRVINICHLIDHLYGTDWSKHPPYEQRCEAVEAWCEKNGASFYMDDRENFFISRAVKQARDERRTIVVVEDLS